MAGVVILVDQPNLKKCSRKHFEGNLCYCLDFSMEIYNQIWGKIMGVAATLTFDP